MNANSLEIAKVAAQRFLVAANKVTVESCKYKNGYPYKRVIDYTKETAGCRRSSMDLTRALAEMRKAN